MTCASLEEQATYPSGRTSQIPPDVQWRADIGVEQVPQSGDQSG